MRHGLALGCRSERLRLLFFSMRSDSMRFVRISGRIKVERKPFNLCIKHFISSAAAAAVAPMLQRNFICCNIVLCLAFSFAADAGDSIPDRIES